MLIKVCGLTRQEDVQICLNAGVDFLGFIFHPQSPRYLQPEDASHIPKKTGKRVGVFVHHSLDEILKYAQTADLDLIQLHGPFSISDCAVLREIPIIKVFWPAQYTCIKDFLNDLELYAPYCRYFLFDAGLKGGGHGKTIQSTWLEGLKSPRPWFLAGGLGPDNLQDLVERYNPDGLDFNSGIETSPGVKDKRLIQDICLSGQRFNPTKKNI